MRFIYKLLISQSAFIEAMSKEWWSGLQFPTVTIIHTYVVVETHPLRTWIFQCWEWFCKFSIFKKQDSTLCRNKISYLNARSFCDIILLYIFEVWTILLRNRILLLLTKSHPWPSANQHHVHFPCFPWFSQEANWNPQVLLLSVNFSIVTSRKDLSSYVQYDLPTAILFLIQELKLW